MLSFFNSNIKFNCEVGMSEKYTITASEFTDSINLSELFPNCTTTKYLTTTYIKAHPGNYCLSYSQFKDFVKNWKSKVKLNKLIGDDWFESYVRCILIYGDRFGEHTRDTLINPYSCYNILRNKGRGSEPSLAKIEWNLNFPPLPEISWAIEDCLHALLYGRTSPFEKQVNTYIRDNLERIKFQCGVNNIICGNIIDLGIELDVEPDIRKLDLTADNSLFYFNPPFCEERVRTNFIHIEKCLQEYKSKVRYGKVCKT